MLKNLKNKLKNKKGFTLVELIVVIVIILVLAGTMVPAVTKYIADAEKANVKQDASALLTQVQAEYAESFMPDAEELTTVTLGEVTLTKDAATNGFTIDDTKGVTSLQYQTTKYSIEWHLEAPEGGKAGWGEVTKLAE